MKKTNITIRIMNENHEEENKIIDAFMLDNPPRGLSLAVHRPFEAKTGWQVSETTTGRSISGQPQPTKQKAIDEATKILLSVDETSLRNTIKEKQLS